MKVDIDAMDRRMKWWLLAVSLATLALLILAALAENVYPQWRQTRLAYAKILQREATDARGELTAGQFNIDPDQYVLRDLRRVDRCVTCHAGVEDPRLIDEPQPFRTHPGDFLASHPPKKFGCTICHQGQGPATALPDAHGNVPFWAEPMIPTRYAYAGCGACHAYLRVPSLAELERGRNLVERHDCLACHRIDGRGGTLRPGGAGGMEGPNLSRVGVAGFDPHWYEKHLEQSQTSEVSKTSEVFGIEQSQQAKDGPWKSAFGPVEPDARKTIEAFLASRVGAPQLVEAKALFHTLGCRGCHKVGGVGGDDGPDLTHTGQKDPARLDFSHVPGERSVAQWHAEHLRDPAKIVPDSKMPKAGLSEEQVDLLTLYLLSLRRNDFPEAQWPKDRIRAERLGEREFATDGATLFGTFCAGCHGRSGEGQRFPGAVPFPSVGNPDFLAVASDDFLNQTIRRGRSGRRMPAWDAKSGGLRPEEIQEIIAHLRRLGGVAGRPQTSEVSETSEVFRAGSKPAHPQRRWVQADAKAGEQLFVRNCAGCHGLHGEGIQAPALNHPVLQAVATDDYFVETIGRGRRGTDMNGFRNPSSVHPTLSEADIQSIVAFIRTWETQK